MQSFSRGHVCHSASTISTIQEIRGFIFIVTENNEKMKNKKEKVRLFRLKSKLKKTIK